MGEEVHTTKELFRRMMEAENWCCGRFCDVPNSPLCTCEDK